MAAYVEALATATLGEIWDLCDEAGGDPCWLIPRMLVTRKEAPDFFHCVLVSLTERVEDRAEVA
jgi:hypothetical protein